MRQIAAGIAAGGGKRRKTHVAGKKAFDKNRPGGYSISWLTEQSVRYFFA